MAKSTDSGTSGKASKPYPEFPLFPHATDRWAKKIRGNFHYFGKVSDDPDGSEALKEFNRQWPYLSKGLTPPKVSESAEGCTIRTLCNSFLRAKQNLMASNELSAHSFGEYFRICERIVEHFGKERLVKDLRPEDFQVFRSALAVGCNVTTLKSKINRCRVVFKYASDSRLVERPVEYGASFDRPSAKVLRKARNESLPRNFEAAEVRLLIEHADTIEKAMVLLGINCGFGNTDIANLPQSAVNLDRGWVTYPRPKTEINRLIPLWPETVDAIRDAIRVRVKPVARDDENLCFLSSRGNRLVRAQESRKTKGRQVTINTLAKQFVSLAERAGIADRTGRGFYGLRHTFETVGGNSRDQVAVDAIMGHVDSSMAAIYRHGISEDRLQAVVNTVRLWLWQDQA